MIPPSRLRPKTCCATQSLRCRCASVLTYHHVRCAPMLAAPCAWAARDGFRTKPRLAWILLAIAALSSRAAIAAAPLPPDAIMLEREATAALVKGAAPRALQILRARQELVPDAAGWLRIAEIARQSGFRRVAEEAIGGPRRPMRRPEPVWRRSLNSSRAWRKSTTSVRSSPVPSGSQRCLSVSLRRAAAWRCASPMRRACRT